MSDHINHPEHYTKGPIECIDYIEAQGLGYHAGNAVKYITRYRYKNGIDDLYKAKWYIERLIQICQEEEDGLVPSLVPVDKPSCNDKCGNFVPAWELKLNLPEDNTDEGWSKENCRKPISLA